ncbi:MAG: hypothetical protein E7315_05900 [Clostridiales bacterium]|nr:hypothetical protein [Clostridiales bacterium]
MKCVHLDFHTSPDIPNIGEHFNKEEFTKAIRDSHIDSMTVFAKCHHGYTYYPSKVAPMHPGLSFNLLKEQIEAIHDAGAKAPIYITVGWSKNDADNHPEWHHKDFVSNETIYIGAIPCDDPNTPLDHPAWTTLCPVGDYFKHLEEITHEICREFDVSDGIFYDICFISDNCGCDACKKGMLEMGFDVTSLEDAKKYYIIKRIEMMKRLTGIVHSYCKDAPVFYNGGAETDRPQYHPYQTHYELEDLPTGSGGYDLMPIRAKYFEKYGKRYLGMTGKFHHSWGEFGGFKSKEALRYECADMVSVGASISVGDHLHPCGMIDKSTYSIISHAFDYTSKIEKYSENTHTYTDIGIWTSGSRASDIGASKILQIMHLDFDVIMHNDDLSKYRCIILPDRVVLDKADKERLISYTANGGKLIASYESIFDETGIKKIRKSEYDMDYIEYPMEDFSTPFLSYSSAYVTEGEGEHLAKIYEPYFSRTWGHFCGHKNTPNKTEPASYPALIQNGNVTYFAHPIFEVYNNIGSYVVEQYIIKVIESVYDKYITSQNLPSCARVRFRKSDDDSFYALHILYAPPVNRGNACLIPDFPTLHDVKVTVRTDKIITGAFCVPSGEAVDFEQGEGYVTVSVSPFNLHRLIILEY